MEQMDCSTENLESPTNNAEETDQVEVEAENVDPDVEIIYVIPAKKRGPKLKKQVKSLKGIKIDRFRFLLKQGYPFEKAFLGAFKRPHFEQVATSVALAVSARHSLRDPWLFQMLHHDDKNNFSCLFRKSFHTLIEQGESLEDAWTLARRDADTRTVLETQNGLCDPKSFEGKIRIVIFSTTHPEKGITAEEFRLILVEMRKNFAKIKDIRYIPHLVECTLVPGTGYILAICGDEITVRWVRLTLKWMTLWPTASLCMVREKKFLESCVMTLSIPDGIARKIDTIMNSLKAQNPLLEVDQWSVLSAEAQYKQKLNKLTILVPRKDCKRLETQDSTLNYYQHQLKLVAPEDRTKIGKRAIFRGFFRVQNMETKDLFKTIESENEGVAITEEWKQMHRNGGRISFFVDAASAEAIRAADHQINFQSGKVKLVCQTRISEV